MDCGELRDDQWERLKALVPGGCKGKRGPRTDNRRFLNALLWMARSGGRWRDLPARLGDYRTVKRRYYRWIAMGVLEAMFEALACEADLEWLIDSTIVRAHQQAAGARRKNGGPHAQGLGRSRGGLSTKIHAAGDALGNPIRLIGGPAQENDITMRMSLSTASLPPLPSPIRATTPITCMRKLLDAAARSSFRQSGTARSNAPTTLIFTRSAISSSASSTN